MYCTDVSPYTVVGLFVKAMVRQHDVVTTFFVSCISVRELAKLKVLRKKQYVL